MDRNEAWANFRAFSDLALGRGTAPTAGASNQVRTRELLAAFCEKWRVTRLWLFGSILGSGFRENSDVDILVEFAPDAAWSLVDRFDMEEELTAIVGRKVDLVNRRAIERNHNPIRRRAILECAEPLYVAG